MRMVTGRHPVCVEICEALGIKHARSLEIKMEKDSVVLVRAEFYPEEDVMSKLPAILKRFNLVEVEDEVA